MMWDLDDLVGIGDIAAEYGVGKSWAHNWSTRNAAFPAPLKRVSGGNLYSREQVAAWFKDCKRHYRRKENVTPS